MRFLTCLAATAVVVITAGFAAATPAAAVGESFGCHVAPNANPNYTQGCSPDRPAGTYTVSFQFTGTYTYAWTLSGADGATIVTGCTSTSALCNLKVGNADWDITGQVTATQNGTAITKTASAVIPVACGRYWC